jgi:hypothetical protein
MFTMCDSPPAVSVAHSSSQAGNDAGNDILIGGAGEVTMTGGAGLDDNVLAEMGKAPATLT